jgi:hypothetical protein
MNEFFEPGDAPRRAPTDALPAVEIAYDDELDADPAYRYVIKRASAASADSPGP